MGGPFQSWSAPSGLRVFTKELNRSRLLEQDGMNQREDGGRPTDPQTQGEKGGEGETRRFAQLAQAITYVL